MDIVLRDIRYITEIVINVEHVFGLWNHVKASITQKHRSIYPTIHYPETRLTLALNSRESRDIFYNDILDS
jgi:hypothetical protein